MTNSRVFLIDDYLNRNPDPERIVVGFDDLDRNLMSLRSGNIEYLVTRHIPMQSFYALTILQNVSSRYAASTSQQLCTHGYPAPT